MAKKIISLSVILTGTAYFHQKKKKEIYIQYSTKRKEGKKRITGLLALRINVRNFWSLWRDIQVFCLSYFGPAPVLRYSSMNDAVPGARQEEEKCVTLNSPAGSLTCNFCCSHVVHSWATLGRKKKKMKVKMKETHRWIGLPSLLTLFPIYLLFLIFHSPGVFIAIDRGNKMEYGYSIFADNRSLHISLWAF